MSCEIAGCERPACYVVEVRSYCATHAAELIAENGGAPGGWTDDT